MDSGALRYIPLFADLDDTERAAVLAISTQLNVGKGHYLCEQGTPGDAVLVIELGKAQVRITDVQGKRSQVAMLGPGDVVGEMAFLDAMPRSADVVAMTPVTFWRIPVDRFKELRAKQHPAAFKITRRMALTVCGRLRKVNERVSQLISTGPGASAPRTAPGAAASGSPPATAGARSSSVPGRPTSTPPVRGSSRPGAPGAAANKAEEQRSLWSGLKSLLGG